MKLLLSMLVMLSVANAANVAPRLGQGGENGLKAVSQSPRLGQGGEGGLKSLDSKKADSMEGVVVPPPKR